LHTQKHLQIGQYSRRLLIIVVAVVARWWYALFVGSAARLLRLCHYNDSSHVTHETTTVALPNKRGKRQRADARCKCSIEGHRRTIDIKRAKIRLVFPTENSEIGLEQSVLVGRLLVVAARVVLIGGRKSIAAVATTADVMGNGAKARATRKFRHTTTQCVKFNRNRQTMREARARAPQNVPAFTNLVKALVAFLEAQAVLRSTVALSTLTTLVVILTTATNRLDFLRRASRRRLQFSRRSILGALQTPPSLGHRLRVHDARETPISFAADATRERENKASTVIFKER
jgi:hypothetical protein